jgi:serine/threonine-protein kinase
MEFVDGPSLERLIQAKKRLPWPLAVRLIRPVARALGHAHEQGFVHRDVKPGNILLYRDGRPRLTDFGIVKDIGSLKGYLVQGRAVGTVAYASPEQCLGKRLSGATDMYSLGATFYHALTGRPPFTGETPVKIAQKHAQLPPRPPADLVPDIPRALGKTVERMLAKKVADRLDSMARLDHDLGMILEGKVPLAVGATAPKVNRAALRGLRRTRPTRRTG